MNPTPDAPQKIVECPRCGVILEVPSGVAHAPLRCPSCAVLFRVTDGAANSRWMSAKPAEGEVNLPTPVHAYAADGAAAPQIRMRPDGASEIVCPRCSHAGPIDANRCTRCAAPFATEAVHTRRTIRDLNSAEVALVCAIVGLFCFPLQIFSIAALLLSYRGLMSDTPRTWGISLAASIIGGVGFVGGVAFWVLR